MLKVFVINLKRRPDRLAEITAVLAPLGISFERIEAVDGKDFKHRHQHQIWLSWLFNGFKFMLRGATACMMSHRNVWQRIVDEKIPVALVLEDDAVVADFDSGMLDIDLERLELDLLRIALTQYERHFALGHLRDRHKSARQWQGVWHSCLPGVLGRSGQTSQNQA